MPTIAEQLTQLTQDRDDLVDNLTTKGITGLTGNETFTELVPEVLNISGGGGGATLQTKSLPIYTNDTIAITPDSGYDGLSSVEITTNVVATEYLAVQYFSPFTLYSSNWQNDTYTLTLDETVGSGYSVSQSELSIALRPSDNTANATKVINADLSIAQYYKASNSTTSYITIKAVNPPSEDIIIIITGIRG